MMEKPTTSLSTAIRGQTAEASIDRAKAALLNAHMDMLQAIKGERHYSEENIQEVKVLLGMVDRAAGRAA